MSPQDRVRDFQRDLQAAVRSHAAFNHAEAAAIRSKKLREQSQELVRSSRELLTPPGHRH